MEELNNLEEIEPIAGTSKMLFPESSRNSSVGSANAHKVSVPRKKATAKRKLTMSYEKKIKRKKRKKATQNKSKISEPDDDTGVGSNREDDDEINPSGKSEQKQIENKVVRNRNQLQKSYEERSDNDNDDDGESSDSEDESAEGVYSVERIISKHQINGVNYYFIKWKGWDESANTWEPIEHLGGCSKLLKEFEEREAERKGSSRKRGGRTGRKDSEQFDEVAETSKNMKSYGILAEWPADKEPISVEGVIHVDGVLTYIVKRKARLSAKILDRSNAILVYSESFRKLYPELVISFYERRVLWCDNPKNDTERAAVAAQMQLLAQNQGSKTGNDIANDVEVAIKQACSTEKPSEEDPEGSPSPMIVDSVANVNVNINEHEQETQAINEEEDADILDLNVPPEMDEIDVEISEGEKSKLDKFGLPDDTDATTDVSTSTEDSDPELVEQSPKYLTK